MEAIKNCNFNKFGDMKLKINELKAAALIICRHLSPCIADVNKTILPLLPIYQEKNF